MSDYPSDAAEIITTAAAATKPVELDPEVIYRAPNIGGAIIDLEEKLPAPRRKSGAVSLYEDDSFSRYVNKHKVAGATELYGDIDERHVIALINGHDESHAGWGDHRARLELAFTDDWRFWTGKQGLKGQVEFAELIEDGIDAIVTPPGAEMLELAQTFQAHTSVNFRSSTMLDNGQRQLNYSEDVSAQAGANGQVVIPAEFELGIAPFEGCDPYRVRARLRYRISEGKLAIGYTLVRPEDVVRAAFTDVLARVETATGLIVFAAREPQRA